MRGMPLGKSIRSGRHYNVGSELSQIQQLIQNGHNVEALGRVRRALVDFPSEPNLHNFLGVLEAQASNYLAAEASFRRAIELAPTLTPAYFNLGRLYQENPGKDPQAISKAAGIYKTLLTQQPGNAEARYECARLVCLQGKFEDALSQVSRLPAADQKVGSRSDCQLDRLCRIGAAGTCSGNSFTTPLESKFHGRGPASLSFLA